MRTMTSCTRNHAPSRHERPLAGKTRRAMTSLGPPAARGARCPSPFPHPPLTSRTSPTPQIPAVPSRRSPPHRSPPRSPHANSSRRPQRRRGPGQRHLPASPSRPAPRRSLTRGRGAAILLCGRFLPPPTLGASAHAQISPRPPQIKTAPHGPRTMAGGGRACAVRPPRRRRWAAQRAEGAWLTRLGGVAKRGAWPGIKCCARRCCRHSEGWSR